MRRKKTACRRQERRPRRLLWLTAILLLWAGCLVLPAVGTEESVGQNMPEGFSELTELLPEEVGELLPEGLDSEDPEAVGQALEELTGAERLLTYALELAGVELEASVRLFLRLCGLLLLAALFGVLRDTLGSGALSGAVRFCTTTAIFAAILYTQLTHLQRVEEFFDRLSALMGAMIPITGAVWAMGGNVTTASAGTSTLYVFLTVCQRLCAEAVMPLCCFCMALALCNTLSPGIGLRGMAGTVKKGYTLSLGFIMTLLLAALGSQTAITAARDSVTARTAKMVSSTVIPVVGGSVGDTLRTVASGVGYLKSVVGVAGIAMIFLLLLPVLLSLVMSRLVFLLCGGVAELLGCEAEGRLLSELGQIWGLMVAVVAMCSVMFILALCIFLQTVVAAA